MTQATILAFRSELVPKELSGSVCLSELYLPRFWPSVWIDTLKIAARPSTRERHLRAINRLYAAAQAQHAGIDCLDRILSELDVDALERVLIGFLASLRNETAMDGKDRTATWTTALAFVMDILRFGSSTAGPRAGALQARLLRLEQMYGQLCPSPPRAPPPIRALPPNVVEDLYAIFNPASDRNPFRSTPQRWRNFLIFTLLLRLGLRRGEADILLANAIKDEDDLSTGKTIYWLDVEGAPDDDDDPRRERPGLKTYLAKRQLPVPSDLVAVYDHYTNNFRGRTHHPQLLMSQKGNPLSLRGLSEIFEVATRALSISARRSLEKQGLFSVSCHELRHTCAVTRMRLYKDAGVDLDRAMEKLRMFFGWTPNSEMPRLYGRAYFETTSAEVWNETFDKFVNALRDCVHREIA
ncbi:site-specific recombinase [Bradyrhizobium sp. SYSU BS000235]|uniref:site-specific recombinase n=1 Tax=Bradyrhizobium sp. SYSU BS000235 TaxID=3411332 RepID=UPI003C7248C5